MSISLNATYKNLGKVHLGSVNTMLVRIINNGSISIDIPSIGKSCGQCTSVSIEDGNTSIPPNSSVQMRIVFTPKAMGINKKWVSVGALKFNFEATVI